MTVPLIEQFGPLARDYDVLLCDIWGVVHNGIAAFPEACDALARFRGEGACRRHPVSDTQGASVGVAVVGRSACPSTTAWATWTSFCPLPRA